MRSLEVGKKTIINGYGYIEFETANSPLSIGSDKANAPAWREMIVVITARCTGAFVELRNVIFFIDLLLLRIYVDENYLFDI